MNVALSKQQRILVESSGDIARIMQQILARESKYSRQRDHFWAIGISDKYQLLYVELISLGTKSSSVEPMEVYKLAVQKDAKFMYLCHNNANANAAPPKSYFTQTDRLIQVGKIVGVTLFDVIVIYPDSKDFLSFADVGHMERLSKSKAFVPAYKQIQEIKKMLKEQIELEKAQKIAKKMKKNKFEPKVISDLTGLTLGQIERL
jgi:DNA repair protein RadC